jgi:hypothetical protein
LEKGFLRQRETLIQTQQVIGRLQFQVLEHLRWGFLFDDHRDLSGEASVRWGEIGERLLDQRAELLRREIPPPSPHG